MPVFGAYGVTLGIAAPPQRKARFVFSMLDRIDLTDGS